MAGIVGINSQYDSDRLIDPLLVSIYSLRFRGQDNFGLKTNKMKNPYISSFSDNIVQLRNLLKAQNILSAISVTKHGICVEPKVFRKDKVEISVVIDGMALNPQEIKKSLDFYKLKEKSHVELIGATFFENYLRYKDEITAINETIKQLNGKALYSTIISLKDDDKEELIAFTDPKKINPLCYGKKDDIVMIVSENRALDINNFEFKFSDYVKNNTILLVQDGKIEEKRSDINEKPKHCCFNGVYYSSPDSIIYKIPVSKFRIECGKIAWREKPLKQDFILSAIPTSGYYFTEGIGLASGEHIRKTLVKNLYANRTYDIEDKELRKIESLLKLNPDKELIRNRNVLYGDDSIRRGGVGENLIKPKLRRAIGNGKIIFYIGSPISSYHCFKTPYDHYLGEKILLKHPKYTKDSIERKMEEFLGADIINHITLEGFKDAYKRFIDPEEMCFGCFDGKYPYSCATKEALEYI